MKLKTVRPYQTEAIDKMLELRQTATIGVGCESPTGTGKCLRRGTGVLMYDGSIASVENIVVGDELMGPDSKPRRVLSLSSGTTDAMYRVKPVKGESYDVTGNHILSLKMTGGSKHSTGIDGGSVVRLEAGQFNAMNKTFRHCAKGYRVGVDFEPVLVRIDPYFVGLWLGDGTSRTTQITTADDEIIQYLKDYASTMGLKIVVTDKAGTNAKTVGISGVSGWHRRADGSGTNWLHLEMRRAGMFMNKHIPHSYKVNSREVRLQVLAGLIDSDGHLSCGGYDLVFVVKQLAEDIVFLARSLGLAAYFNQCSKTCTNNGVKGTYWRVSISGNTDEIPVKLARKKAPKRMQKKDVLSVGVKVEKVEGGEYFGFEVDGDHLFLLSDFTVTHNSIMMGMLAERLASQGRRVLVLAHRQELVKGNALAVEQVTGERCWMELNTKARTNYADWRELKGNGGIVSASVDTLQGKRLRGMPTDLFDDIICDEAHHVRPLSKKNLGEPCEACEATGKAEDESGKLVKCEECGGKGKIIESGSKYLKVKTHFNVPIWYGFSGTFWREGYKGKNDMMRVFDQVHRTGTLFEFIDQGWLVDMRILHLAAVAIHLDFTKLGKKGMITDKQAQEVWETHKLEALSALRKGIAENVDNRTTLIFSPKVQHAKWITEFIQQADTNIYPNMGPETAEYVASYLLGDGGERSSYPDDLRISVIERLRAGGLQYCANQGVFTEGTDIPRVAALVLSRLCQSINLIKQMIGRGARTLPGVLDGLEDATADVRKAAIQASGKKDCLVLDFAGAMTEGAGVHIASATDIVDGANWGKIQQEYAKKFWAVMWERGEAPSLLEAKQEIEHATSEWMQGVRAMMQEHTASVEWEVTEINPRGENKQVATTHHDGIAGGASDKQINYAVSLQNNLKDQRHTLPELRAMTSKQIGTLIGELKEIRDQLPAARWMFKVLREQYGHSGQMPLSYKDGQDLIDHYKKHGNKLASVSR